MNSQHMFIDKKNGANNQQIESDIDFEVEKFCCHINRLKKFLKCTRHEIKYV